MEWVRIEMPVTVHLVYNCYQQYPRDALLTKSYTIQCETESSLHSDVMININPAWLSPLANSSLFTCLLQSGSSAGLCQHTAAAASLTYWANSISFFQISMRVSLTTHIPFSLHLGEELGVVPPYESHVSGEQRRRQWAEWDALSAGEAGQHCHPSSSALKPAGWAQGTGKSSTSGHHMVGRDDWCTCIITTQILFLFGHKLLLQNIGYYSRCKDNNTGGG